MKKKYYAWVANGKNGVTETWEECKEITAGVAGAKFKSFESLNEAQLWINAGADYKIKYLDVRPGIYFDAGTGTGNGVEVSVTNDKGGNLLEEILPKKELNAKGKKQLNGVTNNFGELLACKYALQIALKNQKTGRGRTPTEIFGDSKLIIDYWSKGFIKKELPEETIVLAKEVKVLRFEFEKNGGNIEHVSGGKNPADLGFHKN